MQAALYDVDGVGFAVGGRPIVSGLSFRLEPGRIYGLVGPNGSGKSTLIRMLARQQAPSAGRIRFLGEELGRFGDRDFGNSGE